MRRSSTRPRHRRRTCRTGRWTCCYRRSAGTKNEGPFILPILAGTSAGTFDSTFEIQGGTGTSDYGLLAAPAFTFKAAPVPEASTGVSLGLPLGAGLAGGVAIVRRRKKPPVVYSPRQPEGPSTLPRTGLPAESHYGLSALRSSGVTCSTTTELMQSHECRTPPGVGWSHWHQERSSEVRRTFQAVLALA